MKEEIKTAVNAFQVIGYSFEDLGKAARNAGIAFDEVNESFERAFEKAFPKRYRKAKEFQRKIADLQTEFCESLFDDGTMCNGCWRNPSTCEGSGCAERMDAVFLEMTKDQAARKAFEVFGDRYYSFSQRIKNELKYEF